MASPLVGTLLAALTAVGVLAMAGTFPAVAPSRPAVPAAPPAPAAAVPPVQPAVLLRAFDPPAQRWGAGHRGVDLGTTAGAPVVAPADGVVVFAGRVVDRGVLTLLHDDGLRSSVEPVVDAAPVGARVGRGDVVARLDAAVAHCRDGPCLHWGVRRGEDYVDPLALLDGGGPVRLLPVGDGP